MDRSLLEKKQLAELREIASTLDLRGYQRMKKADLVDLIVGAGGTEANGNGAGDASPGGDEHEASTDDDASRQRARDRQPDDRDRGRNADDGGNAADDDDDDRGERDRNKQRRRKNRGGNQQQDLDDAEVREGVLDLLPEGYGFLRTTGYLSGSRDVYVSQSYVRRFHLRRGDRVRGPIRSNNRGNDKFPALARIDTIEGLTVEEHLDAPRADFDDLTAVHPTERLRLESGDDSPLGMRIVDLVAPIGKGQRGLVTSPPRGGKTTLLRQVAAAIRVNAPDAHVMMLLVDERPEEITDLERAIDGEVVSSEFDRPAEDHTAVAELALERAKRLVERGRDVVVLVDSLTRLGRAYNLASTGSGRTLSGGVDAGALTPVKRFFGAGRRLEEGGSLTMLATAFVGTDSVVDEVILDAVAGTANMELRLQRRMRPVIFPMVDLPRSGTRREELLLDEDELAAVRSLRGQLADDDVDAALEALADRLASTSSNAELLKSVETD